MRGRCCESMIVYPVVRGWEGEESRRRHPLTSRIPMGRRFRRGPRIPLLARAPTCQPPAVRSLVPARRVWRIRRIPPTPPTSTVNAISNLSSSNDCSAGGWTPPTTGVGRAGSVALASGPEVGVVVATGLAVEVGVGVAGPNALAIMSTASIAWGASRTMVKVPPLPTAIS